MILQKQSVRIAVEHDLADHFEMRVARLDLLRQRVHVAEPPLERRALEDRRHAGRLVNVIRRFDRRFDRLRAAQSNADAGGGVDGGNVVG